MRTLPRIALAAMVVASLLATAGAARAQADAGQAALVREAEAFMAGYARDLASGNRAGIIDRYDPRGVYLAGQGSKDFMPLDSVRAAYQGRWQPPASFEWRDLSYEPAGPDAVVVIGRFVWGSGDGRRSQFSYTALLLRRDGRLRIRVEDESGAPAPPAAP